MLTRRGSQILSNFVSFQPRPPVYMYICIIIVYVATYIDDTIHYIGINGLSCLSNKDEQNSNKIEAELPQRASVWSFFEEELFNPLFKEPRFSNFI